jgi:hypothetical protein
MLSEKRATIVLVSVRIYHQSGLFDGLISTTTRHGHRGLGQSNKNFGKTVPQGRKTGYRCRSDLSILPNLKEKPERLLPAPVFPLGWCRGRDLNPHDRNGQRILSPSRLPIPPPRQPDIKMEAAPGIEPGNKGFAGPCLTTWPRRLASTNLEARNENREPAYSCQPRYGRHRCQFLIRTT